MHGTLCPVSDSRCECPVPMAGARHPCPVPRARWEAGHLTLRNHLPRRVSRSIYDEVGRNPPVASKHPKGRDADLERRLEGQRLHEGTTKAERPRGSPGFPPRSPPKVQPQNWVRNNLNAVKLWRGLVARRRLNKRKLAYAQGQA